MTDGRPRPRRDPDARSRRRSSPRRWRRSSRRRIAISSSSSRTTGRASPPSRAQPRCRATRASRFVRAAAGIAGRGPQRRAASTARGACSGTCASLVAFLDDDDLWMPEHLARVRARRSRRRPTRAFVHGAATTRGEGGERPTRRATTARSTATSSRRLLRRNFVATSSVVVRTPGAPGGRRIPRRRRARRGPGALARTRAPGARRLGAGADRRPPRPRGQHQPPSGGEGRPIRRRSTRPGGRAARGCRRPNGRLLRRELARRHRRHVKRLLDEGALPRREIRALARRRLAEVPHRRDAACPRRGLDAVLTPRSSARRDARGRRARVSRPGLGGGDQLLAPRDRERDELRDAIAGDARVTILRSPRSSASWSSASTATRLRPASAP